MAGGPWRRAPRFRLFWSQEANANPSRVMGWAATAGHTRTRYPSVMEPVIYAVRDNRALWAGRSLREWVPDLVNVIVNAFDPEQVVLFGSIADGSDGPDSDIDLLVVLSDAPLADRRKLMVELRRAARAIAAPHDLLVTSVRDFARNRNVPGSTEFEPAHHGSVVYERPAA